jgi:hypothetical protein
MSYSMPSVRAHGEFLLYPIEVRDLSILNQWHRWISVLWKQILCTVNLQHHCQAHKCAASGTEFIYEERAKTSKTKPVIHHSGDPGNLILNTAQMHDAKHMQGLRIPVRQPDMNLAILEGAAREVRTCTNDTISGASSSAHGRGVRGRQVNTSLRRHSQVQSVVLQGW